MKDKLLYGTIGLLVGVVVMQWTMPSGQASITTLPVAGVLGMDSGVILTVDGTIWAVGGAGGGQDGWIQLGLPTLPISTNQILYWDAASRILDKSGDYWEYRDNEWHNYGQPPIGPVANDQSTWGKVKSKFRGGDEK